MPDPSEVHVLVPFGFSVVVCSLADLLAAVLDDEHETLGDAIDACSFDCTTHVLGSSSSAAELVGLAERVRKLNSTGNVDDYWNSTS